jgi:hypothetical protein
LRHRKASGTPLPQACRPVLTAGRLFGEHAERRVAAGATLVGERNDMIR